MSAALLSLAALTAVVAAVRGVWSPCGLSMLSSLNPVAERARGHRFGVTAGWYVAGAVVGGGALGGLCSAGAGLLGATDLPVGTRWAGVLVCAVVAVGSDTGVAGRSLPVHPRQVDERWLTTYRRWIYAAGYGVQIGAGFTTYIMSAAVYLTAALAVLTCSPQHALALGVLFGLVRGLAILLCVGARTPERLRTLLAGVDALGPASLRVACLAECGVGVTAAWSLGGPAAAASVGVVLLAAVAVGARRVPAAACSAVGRDDHVDEAHLLQHLGR